MSTVVKCTLISFASNEMSRHFRSQNIWMSPKQKQAKKELFTKTKVIKNSFSMKGTTVKTRNKRLLSFSLSINNILIIKDDKKSVLS